MIRGRGFAHAAPEGEAKKAEGGELEGRPLTSFLITLTDYFQYFEKLEKRRRELGFAEKLLAFRRFHLLEFLERACLAVAQFVTQQTIGILKVHPADGKVRPYM